MPDQMETLKFQKTLNNLDRVSELIIGGLLNLENSQKLQKELVGVMGELQDQVKIIISNPEEIDLSCIQLIIAFIKYMDANHITCQFEWNLDEDQRLLLENVGLSTELFIPNTYA